MTPFSYGAVLHTVQPGDSLFYLAQRYNTDIQDIMASNPGVDLNTLYIGQGIYVKPGFRSSSAAGRPRPGGMTQAEMDLRNQMRILWEQHITWTRLAIMSIVFNLPDADLVTNRLLRNPKDFEAALTPLYGPQAAARFSDLLKDHLVIAAKLVKAAKAGDSRTAYETEKIWYENARDIAALLASINPNWSRAEGEKMMFDHLALVKSEAVDMLNKNYLAEINLYDEMERKAMLMADELSRGIVKQFPDRFR